MELNPKALGYALGVLLGGFWLIAMGFSLLTGVGRTTISILGGLHPFFTYSWSGFAVVTVEHLVAGFIIGWIFATLYNKFLKS